MLDTCVAVGIDDIDLLAKDLFKAKSQELLHMSASQIVMGDLKSFSMNCGNGKTMEIAFGVVETTDTDPLVLRREELSFELTAYKAENKKDACFLALVNIQGLFSMLITVGPIEQAIARGSYPDGKFEETTGLYSLGSRVSRKKEFIPPLQNFFTKGWTPPQEVEEEKGIAAQDLGELVHECSPEEGIGCRIVRRKSLQLDQILVRRKSLELIPPSASLESKSAQ